jgi:Ca2+-binding EF-hand superfamily protein
MNGKIDFEEFVSMMKMLPYAQDTEDDIEKTFYDIT